MIDRLADHINDHREPYAVAAVILTIAVCVCWFALGPVSAGYAHI